MTGIILAAGRGSRLAPMGWEKPKCLLEFGGCTLLEHVAFSLLDNGVRRAAIVLGYQMELIEERLKDLPLEWHVIRNPDYAATNTINSLWLARDYLDDDFLYFNADVVFDRRILPLLLERPESSLGVQVGRCAEEEIKVVVDEDLRIIEIGKTLSPERCLGEFIGVAKFARDISASLLRSLEEYNERRGQRNLFFEMAIDAILDEHVFRAVDIGSLEAIEIDCPEDYHRAADLATRSAFGPLGRV